MEAYEVTFDIGWDPLAFVKEQKYGEVVEKVITLTGFARDAQALTCSLVGDTCVRHGHQLESVSFALLKIRSRMNLAIATHVSSRA